MVDTSSGRKSKPAPSLLNDAQLAYILHQSWPARAVQSAVSAFTLPGDVYAGRTKPNSDEAAGRSFDLAGLLTLGAGAAPSEGASLRAGARSFRNTREPQPQAGTDYMMFTDNAADAAGYGDHGWQVDAKDYRPVSTKADDPLFRRQAYRALREYGEDRSAARDLVDEANPRQIANSAGLWDSPSHVEQVWNKVLEPRGLLAVETDDGVVVFDPSLVRSRSGLLDDRKPAQAGLLSGQR
jgi:hypothetical protein